MPEQMMIALFSVLTSPLGIENRCSRELINGFDLCRHFIDTSNSFVYAAGNFKQEEVLAERKKRKITTAIIVLSANVDFKLERKHRHLGLKFPECHIPGS